MGVDEGMRAKNESLSEVVRLLKIAPEHPRNHRDDS